LETLYLVKIDLEDNDVKPLVKGFSRMPNLCEIDLSHNHLVDTYPNIMNSLIENCQIISSISMSSCLFYGTDNDITLNEDKHRQGFSMLKRLDLSGSIRGDK
jgi:Ran GTPase-activating protein (RanGAP) involved in mRNA processing and transport